MPSLPVPLEKSVRSLSTKQWVTPFRVLLFMSAVFFLIYVDRGTIASNGVNGKKETTEYVPASDNSTVVIEETIEGSGLQGELGLKNSENGLLSSMFMVGMGLAIPICSEAVYRFNAFRMTGLSLLIWSISTILCGFSVNFATIAICRMFVGIGEAAIISLAPPYIDDHAPSEQRTLWLSCLFVAVPVGYAMGYGYGGVIGGQLGWRAAFIIEGVVMLPFVLFCFCAKPLKLNMKTASGQEDVGQNAEEQKIVTFWRHTREIFSHTVYIYILIGYIFYTTFIGVLAYWAAKAAKSVYGMEDYLTGGVAAVFGLSGALLGGFVLDRIGSTISRALTMSSVCCLIPGIIAPIGFLLRPPMGVFLVLYSICLLLLFSLQAPVQASILWCMPPNHRTLANGLSVLLIHLFGDVPAPPLFGALLDEFNKTMNEEDSYSKALCLTAMVLLVAGVFFMRAAWVGRTAKDYRYLNAEREDGLPTQQSSVDSTEAPHMPLLA